MDKDYLTLQDAAVLLGKSVQTVRRMVKKGEIKAQRIRTPQGFHYVVKREDLGIQMLYNSPIQNGDTVEEEAEKEVLTNQTEILTNQTDVETHKKADFEAIDKKDDDLSSDPIVENSNNQVGSEVFIKIIEAQHAEKLFLIQILDRLQRELDCERRRPRTFFAYLIDWFF